MIIVLRGHIRNSFNNLDLYNFINYLSNNYTIEIYIHTWSIKQNNISWRLINNDFTEITKNYIQDYFQDLYKYIKKIIIDNDNNIKLIGNLDGKILSTKTSIIGWKRYIYSQYRILEYIYNFFDDKHIFVVNTRFDLFTNSFVFPFHEIINFIKNNYNKIFTKNIFLRNDEYCGIDNIILGNIQTNYHLMQNIHLNLDKILLCKNNQGLQYPEFIVSRTNNEQITNK